MKEELARCHQKHQPKRETLQVVCQWRGDRETEVGLGLGTGTDGELLTKVGSTDVITSLLWGPRPRNPDKPQTVISRQNKRGQPGTRP